MNKILSIFLIIVFTTCRTNKLEPNINLKLKGLTNYSQYKKEKGYKIGQIKVLNADTLQLQNGFNIVPKQDNFFIYQIFDDQLLITSEYNKKEYGHISNIFAYAKWVIYIVNPDNSLAYKFNLKGGIIKSIEEIENKLQLTYYDNKLKERVVVLNSLLIN